MISGRGILWLAAAVVVLGLGSPAAASCRMAKDDALWLGQALANWRIVERDRLRLAPVPLPQIVAVDAQCAYRAVPEEGDRLTWKGAPHGGTIAFPDGKTQPLGPISFASPVEGDPRGGYFAMSLPSVWRAAGVKSGLGLERMMDGVLLHELMHTRQFYFANPRLVALAAQYHLPDDISDDSLQAAFEKDPAYVAAYTAERDALFAAAAAPTDTEARTLAAKALALMKARRARWFTGDAAKWAPLDDLFLDMEGLGQWTAYAWFTDPRGGAMTPAAALPEVRRGGKYWSQDEGLALFLAVDRLVPNWQALAFSPQPALSQGLLEAAVGLL